MSYRSRTWPLLPAAVLAATLVTGCGADAGSDGRPQVVASFYPLEYLTERIAGDHVQVLTLTAPGQEPHDIELPPSKVAAISDAALVVYARGLQSAVDDGIDTTDPDRILNVTEAIDLLPMDADEHDEHAGHDHGDLDPHFWLDPQRYATVAEAIHAELVALDPDHAADYDSNLAALTADLTALDVELSAGLSQCERRTVVVTHDAFGYLGHRYDLELHSIVGLSPEAEPSPAHIAELHRLIEDHGITTVFSEELTSAKMAEALADDLGLRTAVLSPLEGLTEANADQDYLSLMRANLAALQEANGCR